MLRKPSKIILIKEFIAVTSPVTRVARHTMCNQFLDEMKKFCDFLNIILSFFVIISCGLLIGSMFSCGFYSDCLWFYCQENN